MYHALKLIYGVSPLEILGSGSKVRASGATSFAVLGKIAIPQNSHSALTPQPLLPTVGEGET